MKLKFSKKTKILATLGPASSDKQTMLEMIRSGVNVFRINFSHADYETATERIRTVREINKEYGYHISILADLQGPKLRIGKVQEGVSINIGDELIFTNEKIIGNGKRVYMLSLIHISFISMLFYVFCNGLKCKNISNIYQIVNKIDF